MSKRRAVWLLLIIMVLATCNFVYWSEQKQGFHCDEIYSHGLSNSTFHYNVYDENGNIKWNTAEDIDAYMTVSDDGRFNYANVYNNQKLDVHPPLFYMIMHSLASFFPGTVSIYFVIIPNILFTLGTCIFVYLIAMGTMKKRSPALLSVLCFAFSVNCINMILYMRMYAQLTFFTTALTYLYIRLRNNCYELTNKTAFALGAVIFLGAYTHYYFFIFLFSFVLLTVYALIRKKNKKLTLRYLKLSGITAGLYILVWPYVFRHIFGTTRGEQAFVSVMQNSWQKSLKSYLFVFKTGVSDVIFWLFLLSLVIGFFSIIRNNRPIVIHIRKYQGIGGIALAICFYFLMVAKVAPFKVDRYIAVVFPLFAVVFVAVLYQVWVRLSDVSEKKQPFVLTLMALIVLVGLGVNQYQSLHKAEASNEEKNYLFRIRPENQAIFDMYADTKCIMVPADEWQFLRNFPDYKHFQKTAFVRDFDIEKLREDPHLADEDECILYISMFLNADEVLKTVKQTCGFDSHELLLEPNSRNWGKIYRLYKQ